LLSSKLIMMTEVSYEHGPRLLSPELGESEVFVMNWIIGGGGRDFICLG